MNTFMHALAQVSAVLNFVAAVVLTARGCPGWATLFVAWGIVAMLSARAIRDFD